MAECPRCHTRYDEMPAFCGTCGTKMSEGEPLVEPAADPLIGVIIDGRYRLVDLIGRGGMGAVYRVEHVKMGKIMAMKILHGELSQNEDLARRFKREAETVSRLNHLNTVSVFDFGSDKGMMYLVMEYIEGRDLSDVLRIDGPLPFMRCARILMQVCSALNEAHSKGIIHRDLKPENILVGKQDEREDFVKVLDFGLAKLRDFHRTKITQQGSLVGTPYYMAPEHIKSEGVDQRSDIYALGAVMYKLLTGETPFKASTPMGIITKHLTEDPAAPSIVYPKLGIPKLADEICLKAMSKSPLDRYASANEMRKALANALNESAPGSARPRSSAGGQPSWHLGKLEIPSEEEWTAKNQTGKDAGAGNRKSFDPDETVLASASANLARSIIIGERQIGISTRSDFFQFEKKFKRRRLGKVLFALAALLMLMAGGVVYMLYQTRGGLNPTSETEPNDSPQDADVLAPGMGLRGFISGDKARGDIDWYYLRGPATGRWAVSVEVSGVEGIDIALQLVHPEQIDPVATANTTGKGGGESIGPWVIQRPAVYLLIQEARAPSQPASSAASPYEVVYHVYDARGLEVEPNNRPAEAMDITLGESVRGTIGTAQDRIDWFSVAAGREVQTVQVSTSPNIDIELEIQMANGPEPLRINHLGLGQGEGIRLPKTTGPTRIGIRAVGSTVASGTYQLLAQ